MKSLRELNNVSKILELYDKNKDKEIGKWLSLETIFKNSGKQGIVGLFKIIDEDILIIFKYSQYINYLTESEFLIGDSLNEIADFCPNFSHSIGTINTLIDPDRHISDPFQADSKYKIEKNILLTSYIKNSRKFYNYIFSKKVSENCLYSIVKQVLNAVSIGQNLKKFTHYDLHSNNVMVKKCSRNLVLFYIIDDKNYFLVPTYGYIPVVIDFGFSYSEALKGESLFPSLNHTHAGFTSYRYDFLADPKVFLVTVSDEIYQSRKTIRSKNLRNITRNIFKKLDINWDSGWDTERNNCLTDNVLDKISEYLDFSKLFKNYEYYCMDLLQSLIICPLEKQKTEGIELYFLTFISEFKKIENQISSPFYCLFILKGIIDTARTVRKDYLKDQTRDMAVSYFRKNLLQIIDSVSSFANLKEIHFEKMLCSLYCLTKCMEGILFEKSLKEDREKMENLKKLSVKNVPDILKIIDYNLEEPYIYNEKTTVMVIDGINKSIYNLNLNEEIINEINLTKDFLKGEKMFSFLKNL